MEFDLSLEGFRLKIQSFKIHKSIYMKRIY